MSAKIVAMEAKRKDETTPCPWCQSVGHDLYACPRVAAYEFFSSEEMVADWPFKSVSFWPPEGKPEG